MSSMFMKILKKGINQNEMSLDEYLNLHLFDKQPYCLVFKEWNVVQNDK